MTLPTRRIGDVAVSAVGLGCMPVSRRLDGTAPPHEDAIATIHAALDAGITLLDTANVYAPRWDLMGHNERIVGEAVRTYSGPADLSKVMIATKGGITRSEGEVWGRDSRADALKAAAEKSLLDLGVDRIDLYQLHRHDPTLTYAAQMHSLAAVRDAGLVARVGLSNCTLPELDVALEILGGPLDGGVVSVQNEYSPRFREDADVMDRCTQLGIAFLPWSPLGGATHASVAGSKFTEFAVVADEVGASPQEVVIAWLLALTPVMIPIPGASRPVTIASIVRGLDVVLSDEQMSRLSASTPEGTSMFADDTPRSPLR